MTKLNQKALNFFKNAVNGLLDNPEGSQNHTDGEHLEYYVLFPIVNGEKPDFGALETGMRDYIPTNILRTYSPELINKKIA